VASYKEENSPVVGGVHTFAKISGCISLPFIVHTVCQFSFVESVIYKMCSYAQQ